jgi:hypothetical protein
MRQMAVLAAAPEQRVTHRKRVWRRVFDCVAD